MKIQQMKANPQLVIFQTQPIPSVPAYQRFMEEVKTYTQNLNQHLNKAFKDQNMMIKRKRQQLQKQLEILREKFYAERIRIIEMQDQFKRNCEDVIRNDMNKWDSHQNFFSQLLQHYHSELEIQNLINERNREKVWLLKQELKECLKADVKQQVAQKLQQKQSLSNLSKSKIKSKSSLSIKSESKLTQFKLKTEASQNTRPTQVNQNISHRYTLKIKSSKLHTQLSDTNRLPSVSQKLVRLKTDMSLPSLKKSTILNFQQRIQNDDFNFMKPIKTVKQNLHQKSLIPEIIRMFLWQKAKFQSLEMEPDWFEKVVFNKRNLEKILAHLEKQFQKTSGKNKFPQSANKVKDLVAKNLFRLKTQSSSTKNRLKLELKEKSLLSVLDKSPQFSELHIK